MSKTDAAYMKAYRARRKAEATENASPATDHFHETARWLDGPLSFAAARCTCGWLGETYETSLPKRYAQLEAEVEHLKAELAKKVPYKHIAPRPAGFNSRPFTPAPKGK